MISEATIHDLDQGLGLGLGLGLSDLQGFINRLAATGVDDLASYYASKIDDKQLEQARQIADKCGKALDAQIGVGRPFSAGVLGLAGCIFFRTVLEMAASMACQGLKEYRSAQQT